MGPRSRFLAHASTLALAAAAAAQSPGAQGPVLCDLDRDGLPDVYAHGSGRDDVLLRNTGDGGFADVTAEAGLAGLRSRQVLPGDFDRDGHQDLLLVTQAGAVSLFRGLGELAFQDATHEAGLEEARGAARVEWIDYDRDGRDDLLLTTADGAPVFFHNMEGLSFERVELGISAATAPVIVPVSALEEAAPETGTDTGKGLSASGGRTPVEVESRSVASDSRGSSKLLPADLSLAGLGGTIDGVVELFCAKAVEDIATNNCMLVSSTPTLGMLYPISQNLYVDAVTGNVGIGSTAPTADLYVAGDADINGRFSVSLGGTAQVFANRNLVFGGLLGVLSPGGIPGVELLGGTDSTGGRLTMEGPDGPTAILSGNSFGLLRLLDTTATGTTSVELFGRRPGGTAGSVVLNDPVTGTGTVELWGDSDSDGGTLVFHHTVSGTKQVEILGDTSSGGGSVMLYDDAEEIVANLSGTGDRGRLFLKDTSSGFNNVAILGTGDSGGEIVLGSADGEAGLFARAGDADDGASLSLYDANEILALTLAGDLSDAAVIHLFDGFDPAVFIRSNPGSFGTGGLITIHSGFDQNIRLEGDAGNGEGRITVRDGNLTTVELRGIRDGTGAGGTVDLFNDAGAVTARLIGDEGTDSGRLVLLNEDGVNSFISASLRAVAGAGQGAQLRLRSETNNLMFDMDATSGGVATNTGELTLREQDTSIAWRFQNDVFEGRDSSGTVTISYNRNTGAKNAVVGTESYGRRTLYCEESTEVWFSDYGSGGLVDGEARIELDPIFLETVVVDDENPLKVFLTPTAPIGDYWVEKRARGFVVHAGEGVEGTFDWRVVAKRRGLEDERLEPYGEGR